MEEKQYESLNIPSKFKLEVLYSLTTSQYKGCILCVHGVCHGAWCFENFLEFFPKYGFDCFALSFRGHSGSQGHEKLNEFGISDYSEDIKECINYCMSIKKIMKSTPFILGHSMGGAVVQNYIGEHSDAVKGAILFAPATAGGMKKFKTFIDTYFLHKDLRIAAKKASGKEVTDKELFESAFFDKRVPMNDIRVYNKRLQIESKKITLEELYKSYTSNYSVNLPILVIGSYEDSYFPESSLNKTYTTYKNSKNKNIELEILPDLCHDMMLDPAWEKSANIVLKFMENNI